MFNLLNEKDVTFYYKKVNPFASEEKVNEIISTLKIFSKLHVSSELLEFDDKGFVNLKEHSLVRKIPITDIFKFVQKLITLEKYKGFQTLSAGLNNPTQFCDTMFEVDCIHFIAEQSNVIDLELSPEILISSKVKKPDFRFVTKEGVQIFCECKSIASVHRIKASRIVSLLKYIEPYLPEMRVENYRIEIAFKILPPHWNRNYCEQLMAAIKVLAEKEMTAPIKILIDGKYETYLKLSKTHEDLHFNCVLNLGDKPPLENPKLIIGEFANLQKDIKNNIHDALTQLPDNYASAVFIYSLNQQDAEQVMKNFFINNNKPNFCGVFSWASNLNYYHNPRSSLNIIEQLGMNGNKS